jgi:hypothetical protein
MVYNYDTLLSVTTVATSIDLATYGLEPVDFDYPRLLRSEAAAKRGKHHPLKEALAKLRGRHRG